MQTSFPFPFPLTLAISPPPSFRMAQDSRHPNLHPLSLLPSQFLFYFSIYCRYSTFPSHLVDHNARIASWLFPSQIVYPFPHPDNPNDDTPLISSTSRSPVPPRSSAPVIIPSPSLSLHYRASRAITVASALRQQCKWQALFLMATFLSTQSYSIREFVHAVRVHSQQLVCGSREWRTVVRGNTLVHQVPRERFTQDKDENANITSHVSRNADPH